MLLNENFCEGPKTLRKFVAELRELASMGTTIRSGIADAPCEALPANQNPSKAITALQAPSIDRLHWHLCLSFRNHDSQITVTLGTGALEVLGHGTSESRRRCQSRHP
jgi:hypothetical protein